MERLLKLLPFLLFLAACGRSPGFKAEDYEYRRVQGPEALSEKTDESTQEVSPPGTIVRFSNKITFVPTETNWEQDQVKLKANVQFADQSFGDLELVGVKKDSRILLTPSNPEISQKLKAQVICMSEGDNCEEFFVDVFYKDKEVIYQDQVIPKLKKQPKSSDEKKNIKGSQSTPQTSGVDRKKNGEKGSVPTDKKRTAEPLPAARSGIFALGEISDGGPDEAEEKAAYIGTSDEEIRKIFEVKSSVKSQAGKKEVKETQKRDVPSPAKQRTPPKDETSALVSDRPSAPSQSQSGEKNSLEQFRERDQVIGSAWAGRLNKGTDFLKISQLPGFSFFIVNPKGRNYFASFDMAVVIKKFSEVLQSLLPGRKLAVTSMSKWGGGRLPPHGGHQNGTDADFRYLTNDETKPSNVVTRGRVNNTLLVKEQWTFFKKAFETGHLDVIFVDKAVKRALCEEARRVQDLRQGENDSVGAEVLKRIQTWGGHANHFHVRIKCSSDNPRCKQALMSSKATGC